MERHSPTTAKKLWNLLRIAFFMMRKGLISKRKLVMDLNLMMKRGKIKGKNLGHLVFHHHGHRPSRGHGSSLQEYEFSCDSSPNTVLFRANKRRCNYFPCLNSLVEEEADGTPRPALRIEYSPSPCLSPPCLVLSQEQSPLRSPFSVRVSNYSDEESSACDHDRVDDEAEQFIGRFYEQLRAQCRVALIQYREMEVQQMLARGR